MSTFEVAIQSVLAEEGELVVDPEDKGGATKYGISFKWLKSLEDLPPELGLRLPMTLKTIEQLTESQAVWLYRHYFWDPHHYERILDQRIATKVFSFTVNAGHKASHTALQWALRASGNEAVLVDGVLGIQTLKAVNAAEAKVLLAALRSEMAGYYRRLHQPHFEMGWLKRAYS